MCSLPLTRADSSFGQASRVVVGVGDLATSADVEARLITFALGSCLGLTVYDPVARVGGLLHVMLPDSGIDRQKAQANPAMFVDTGVPRLFHDAYRLGAVKQRLIVKVAGGATVHSGSDLFEIGKRNLIALRKVLWSNGVMIKAQDVGGTVPRTLTLDVATGGVTLRIDAVDSTL